MGDFAVVSIKIELFEFRHPPQGTTRRDSSAPADRDARRFGEGGTLTQSDAMRRENEALRAHTA